MTRRSFPRLTGSVLALSLVLVVAACSVPAASAPAPVTPATSATPITASPEPSPTPTPAPNVAELFRESFSSPTFAANATISGQFTAGPVSGPITGTFAVRAGDSRQEVTIASETTGTINVDGVNYVLQNGLWFEEPADAAGSAPGSDLATTMRSALDVTDVGVETIDGRALHHLMSTGSPVIPLSAIGAADPYGDGVVTFEFYVEDDGTPVIMSVGATWTQPSGDATVPASMGFDYTFANVGGAVVIDPPEQVWAPFTSRRYGYSIAYPLEWEASASPSKKDPDVFYSAENTAFLVWRYPTEGSSLNAITSGYVKHVKKESKSSVVSNTKATIDGRKARRLEWTAVFDGSREYEVEYVVVRGKYVYFFMYSSLAPHTDADRAMIDAFVSTIDLP